MTLYSGPKLALRADTLAMSALCDPPDPHAASTPAHISATTVLGFDIVANVHNTDPAQPRNAVTVAVSRSVMNCELSGG